LSEPKKPKKVTPKMTKKVTSIRSLTEKIGVGLDNLDFTGRQELLRLLIEKVLYDGQGVEIQTIITLGEQLHPIHRGGQRGRVS